MGKTGMRNQDRCKVSTAIMNRQKAIDNNTPSFKVPLRTNSDWLTWLWVGAGAGRRLNQKKRWGWLRVLPWAQIQRVYECTTSGNRRRSQFAHCLGTAPILYDLVGSRCNGVPALFCIIRKV